MAGVHIAWDDYTPYTLKEFPPDKDLRSIALMALGGKAIDVQIALGPGNFAANNNDEAMQAGQKLAEALKPAKDKKNLLLIMGPMHTPLNEHVEMGLKKVFADPLPQNIKLLGWATSYWGGQAYYKGELTKPGTAIVGIMITGDFDWAFRGQRGWRGAAPAEEIARMSKEIVAELKGRPDVTFVVLGHPPRTVWAAVRDAFAAEWGRTSPSSATTAAPRPAT